MSLQSQIQIDLACSNLSAAEMKANRTADWDQAFLARLVATLRFAFAVTFFFPFLLLLCIPFTPAIITS